MTWRPALGAAGLLLAVSLLPVSTTQAQTTPQVITVSSPTLKEGQPVPRQHTPDGRNDSPALTWSNVPAGTRELMVFCEDPDVGVPPPFVHWAVYKIPASAHGLPEALPIDPSTPMPAGLTGAMQGMSGFRRPIYRGPAPPPGKPHSYHFVVYALDTAIAQKPGTPPMTRAELLDAAKGHIIGRGELVATYQRQ
ncbi:MAG: YbhB/YbcL family Raf kinase inhibitor-like protein [Vicinamibacterales bacterium]